MSTRATTSLFFNVW